MLPTITMFFYYVHPKDHNTMTVCSCYLYLESSAHDGDGLYLASTAGSSYPFTTIV